MNRWIAFNVVGFGGFIVQLLLLTLLTRHAHINIELATLLAVEAAILHNFCLHQRWTWRDRPAGAASETAARLVRFHAANGFVSLMGNVALTSWLSRGAGLDPVLANVVSVIVCSLVNYLAGDRVVFRTAPNASR